MMYIIIGLIITLILIVVVVNAIQQHKEKQEAEKRARIAKQRAIFDESEELLLSMGNLPPNPVLVEILNRRSLNAAKTMYSISPDNRTKNQISELEARLKAAAELAASAVQGQEVFMLPDNEQHLVAILQCIKKLRVTLKSEQSKGVLDSQIFIREDQRLDLMQLRINIESLLKRGDQAFAKEMVGSARQYYEKALQTLQEHPLKTEYSEQREAELQQKLGEITSQLANSNAESARKKAKEQEDELDMLFQPKKKW